jgi:hypothetical protein
MVETQGANIEALVIAASDSHATRPRTVLAMASFWYSHKIHWSACFEISLWLRQIPIISPSLCLTGTCFHPIVTNCHDSPVMPSNEPYSLLISFCIPNISFFKQSPSLLDADCDSACYDNLGDDSSCVCMCTVCLATFTAPYQWVLVQCLWVVCQATPAVQSQQVICR